LVVSGVGALELASERSRVDSDSGAPCRSMVESDSDYDGAMVRTCDNECQPVTYILQLPSNSMIHPRGDHGDRSLGSQSKFVQREKSNCANEHCHDSSGC
jgi:hypothetical protein